MNLPDLPAPLRSLRLKPLPPTARPPHVLLIYPEFPPSYWGLQYMMPLVGRRALMPPLGLITVAALLPKGSEVRLVDMNVSPLTDQDLDWADLALLSAMLIQRRSLEDVVARCRAKGVRTVAGGPLVTALSAEFGDIDHLLTGEVEDTAAAFFERLLANPDGAPRWQPANAIGSVDVTRSPVPRFDLLPQQAYLHQCVQFSRGCPFNCEFCDIIEMYGRTPRTKTIPQLLAELDAIHATGWRGSIFIVDDNFIGHKPSTKALLRAIGQWQRERAVPFGFITEASINLAWDDQLLSLMVEAGFYNVFMGIETPSTESLRETGKLQNLKMDLVEALRLIRQAGIEVSGGFIVGFDNDDATIFDRQIAFIDDARVPHAMVGLLTALPGTQLEARLAREGRLVTTGDGNFFSLTNFRTKLDTATLRSGYGRLLAAVYEPRAYFQRCLGMLLDLGPPRSTQFRPPWSDNLKHLGVVAASFLVQGILSPYRRHYWRFLFAVARRLPHALICALYGHHYFCYTKRDVLPALTAKEGRP